MSTNSLITQGSGYTYEQLNEAINQIDMAFKEEGYAQKHPELVGQYLVASAINGAANALTSQCDLSASTIATAIENISALQWGEVDEDGEITISK
ncbi:MAG: hypothetical protein RR202_10435 [Bacteroidales bacterium]